MQKDFMNIQDLEYIKEVKQMSNVKYPKLVYNKI